MNFVLSMTLICIAIAPADEPPAGVDAPLTATPVVWITLLQLISAVVFASEVSKEPYKKYWLHIRLLRFPAEG